MTAEIIPFRPRPRQAPADNAFAALALFWASVFAAAAAALVLAGPRDDDR